MKFCSRHNKGFTLVEIMIVVAIIGLLAAFAIPNFVRARMNSQQKTCINNLRQIDAAIQQWATEQRKGPTESVNPENVFPYLHSGAVCPSGGTDFADSYGLGTASDRPVCLRMPDTHVLP